MFKKIGAALLSAGIIFSAISTPVFAEKPDSPGKSNSKGGKKIENVIYLIPDGFSANYAANYRVFKGEDAVWDNHLKGMFSTYSANSAITDSAAAGTAMATGVKTNNGVIGLDTEGNELTTILEASEQAGKASGLVATSTITHATPAVFASHVDNRNNQTEIARQYIASDVDVFLGGGKDMFLPKSEGGNQEELDLIEQAQEVGFTLVETQDELLNTSINLKKGERLLGLFADDALSPELHRDETTEPSIAEMTQVAIDTLDKNKKGFFLMVEGSQIDWAGHANDAAWAMTDVEAFEQAVEVAIDYAKKDKKTLVVVAGDHDTGGMTTGANGSLKLNANILQNVTATGEYMAAQLNEERSNVKDIVEQYTSLNVTDQEIEYIRQATNVELAINKIVSDYASVGWTSTNHTGADIPVYAFGPQSEKFVGFHDNTDLPKIIANILKVNLGN
ncbi:alkaline phosphatase [Gracilibacillus sp. S3-1-1]|uniref:Alkaline phosphatase n=1 Tax=Gracilibacillus pellucidus TaxID=3095368 RepID=A0ACC6M0K8_9BACI|nr:alkaline phosphatase [Gracilibacillus sp. S3-1-1]MDX8044408.1 alkaline phosphatase [Gracilibacillus sp. S3-1-1]